MRTVRLNDGTTYAADWCGASGGALHIDITGAPGLLELAQIFGDPAKTAHIVFEYGEMSDTYDGYTHLLRIAENEWRDGATLVTMTKSEE